MLDDLKKSEIQVNMFENDVKDQLRGGSNEQSIEQPALQPVLGPADLDTKNIKGQSSTFAKD